MLRFFVGVLSALTVAVLSSNSVAAQPTSAAYELLPDNTQAVVWIRSGEELLERWDRTQLSKLLADKTVAPFFDEQRQEIEQRFLDAGWRLNIKPEDLSDYSVGQITFAWMDKKDTPLKPFSLALIADVEDDPVINERMMKKIEDQLDRKKTKKMTLSHAGVTITKYSLPPRKGELIPQDSYFAIHQGLLLSSDDEQMVKQLIDRAIGKESGANRLSNDPTFVRGRELAKISELGQLEYFVRPLGFARVIRSIAGKRSRSTSDMLAVLENQGFSSIRCICGELILGQEALDVQHRGYVYAQRPLEKSAGVLDFLNEVSHDIPNFVGENVSSFLALNWNVREAFWRTEGLVDELAGTPGVFDEVIEGIKKDPNGPLIDIRQDVLPLLTNEFFSISDSKTGAADVDSRRNLIALKVNDSKAMTQVLNKAMKGEPDAELVEFEGVEIWKVVHREDEDIIPDGLGEFDDFSGPAPAPSADDPQPWLSNWAIAVHGQYMMFTSHAEMIQDAILQAKATETSPLLNSQDYRRVTAAIDEFFPGQAQCAWQITRTDKAYRVQYELFRRGELRRSQSMLASILDRLLQKDGDTQNKDQKIKGEGLPPFDAISKYLQPSGMMARTTDNGWEFGSLLLSQKFGQRRSTEGSTQLGTARIPSHAGEANR